MATVAELQTCDGFAVEAPVGLLGNAVTIFVAALISRDQLGEKADRHHLRPEQQRCHRVDQQRSFMQRLEASGVKLPTNLFQERVLLRD